MEIDVVLPGLAINELAVGTSGFFNILDHPTM